MCFAVILYIREGMMQDTDAIIAKIKDLQGQVIAAATGSVDNRAQQLAQLQAELEKALSGVETMSQEDRAAVVPVVKEFSEQLKQRIEILQQEMHNIRSSAESTKSHSTVAKAYSGKIF